MKKKGILLAVVILLSTVGLAGAQEGDISGTFDIAYLTSYIWRGFDIYGPGDHSAFQASIDLNLYDTGFGAKILTSRSDRSAFGNFEELLHTTLYYQNSFFEGENYVTDYKVGWVYYNWPDAPRRFGDAQEAFAELTLPKLCPDGFVPSYTVVSMWPSKSDSSATNTMDKGGWFHIFRVDYDMTVSGLVPEIPEQIFHLSAEVVYNDGAGPSPVSGKDVEHDWSHFVFGISTDLDLGNNLTLIPGLYQQISMEDSVNSEDETWARLSMSYTF